MSKPIDQELLPCPFCGDPKPNLTHDDYIHEDGRPMAVVECTKCHTWVQAEAWNKRAAIQPASVAVPEGYRLIRIEHFDAIKAQTNPKQVDAYRGRNVYDDGKVHENWRACDSALDEIKDVFTQIEWDAENELAELLDAAAHPVSGEQKQAYPVIRHVRPHSHKCANVQLNATSDTECDCGAVVSGVAIKADIIEQNSDEVARLLAISRKILSKLQHPTAPVHAGDMWKLEEALEPFKLATAVKDNDKAT